MSEQTVEAKDFDSKADIFLDQLENETPTESSSVEKTEDVSRETDKTTTAEVEKTEQVKEVEGDKSLSVEEKIAKIKEILGEDEKALDAYIKQKGYHNDPAWQKQRELIDKLKKESQVSSLSKEDKEALDEFKKFRSSAEYIQTSMKSQGYTQEAIDRKLQDNGFEVKAKVQDDVNMVIEKLGIRLDDMAEEDRISIKSNISDIVRIADILFNDRFGKNLPKELSPVKETIEEITRADNSRKMLSSMQEVVKKEGILDFSKDIEPALHKFMDENPDALQEDVFEHFKELSRNLSIERLRAGKKQEERNEKKSNLRQNIPFSNGKVSGAKKTGNFDNDADAFLDSLNV